MYSRNVALLGQLGISDPRVLDPAPQDAARQEVVDRALTSHPCVGCGASSRITLILEVPGHGPRWLDRCRDCLLASVKRTGPRSSNAEVMAVVVEEARKLGMKPRTIDHI